ncbi:MAG: methyltransferase domain-containing protein [Candidatus Methanoperedens sp.]|nr:methyltransferase domain-containing protein [Candidatus Methanoperedens sp.]MCZ7370606.1 methyltransferase domain-containing protein [Candidatus Methanoperedens sp.]
MTKNGDLLKSNYWDKRYSSGGGSGEGSIGEYRDFKWEVITQYVPKIDNVLDIGCGDLSFWEGRDCEHYTGVDISPNIIEKNRKNKPHWNFMISNSEKKLNLKSDLGICNDVLFHIMDDAIFEKILNNLCEYSKKYIFIFTWNKNPFVKFQYRLNLLSSLRFDLFLRNLLLDNTSDGKYQKYRDLSNYYRIFKEAGFDLVNIHPAPIKPYIGAMYVFRKKNDKIN